MTKIRKTQTSEIIAILEANAARETICHSLRVKKIAKSIVVLLEDEGIDVSKKAVKVGALLHDIGKNDKNNKYHHYKSVARTMKLFDCTSGKKNQRYANQIYSIILSHKGEFKPNVDIALEAAILRMADKIDKYNKSSSKKATASYQKSLRQIERYFKENNIGYYSQLKKACKKVRKNLSHTAGGKL